MSWFLWEGWVCCGGGCLLVVVACSAKCVVCFCDRVL